MAVLEILKMGAPQLMLKARPVNDFYSGALHQTISDMIETMRYYQGVGLAAPQVGLLQQIIVLEVSQNKRYPQAANIKLDVLINPRIINSSEQEEFAWEGCLSLPNLRGRIARSTHITYQAFDAEGKLSKKSVSGFHARIIQHEIDHLNGILYPQRLDSLTDFGFEDSLLNF